MHGKHEGYSIFLEKCSSNGWLNIDFCHTKMSMDIVKTEFDKLVSRITGAERKIFFDWLREDYLPAAEGKPWDESVIQARISLRKLADEMRGAVPLAAVLESETILPPTVGEDAGLDLKNTVHLDSFLYDAQEEERLLADGTIPKSICRDCGSKNTEEITIITHSCSHEKIEFIFRGLLPPLKDKTVLDVGSRLGAVLYGGFHHSSAARLVGVELNSELCDIANKTIKKHCLDKRIEILNEDILNVPKIVKSADVIVLNNVFEWFLDVEQQVKVWRYLKEIITPGTLLVTVPSLETSLENINTGISLDEWVDDEEGANPDFCTDEEVTAEIFLYRVK